MPQPIVHFEIIGKDTVALQKFYGSLFEWKFDTNAPVAKEISAQGQYGFTRSAINDEGTGVPAGVGGGDAFKPQALAYIGVPNVEQALQAAERLGATRVLGPVTNEGGKIVVGQFRDPEGNLIGVAGAE